MNNQFDDIHYILKTTVYSLVPAKRFAKGLPGEIEFLK